MHPSLQFVKTAYVKAQNLLPIMSDYTNPRDCISRLVKNGELIRLKNGFFVLTKKIEEGPIPYEQLANLLYGPSYLSFEWALSYYGMIPEGVYVVTSATSGHSKSFHTSLGTFDYISLSHLRYSIGIVQKSNESGNFLIASPEKALADLVFLKSKHLSSKDLLVDLIEGRRIEEETLRSLDKKHLYDICENYRSQTVRALINAIGII